MNFQNAATLGDDLARNAAHFPDALAFVIGDRRATHAQFLQRSRNLASALHACGVRRQDRISVLAQNCMEFIELYGACEWAGFITATVNFRLAPPEMLYVIRDAAPKMLVFEAEYARAIDAIRSELGADLHYVCIGSDASTIPPWAMSMDALLSTAHSEQMPLRALADDIAYLIYTSGTTGRPKGCILGQRESRLLAQKLAFAHGNTSNDRTLLMMPFFHVGAKCMQLAQHQVGGSVYVQRGFEPEAVLQVISSARITTTHMAPVMVQMLIEFPDLKSYDLSSLRTIVYGAAPMPIPVLRKGMELLGSVFVQSYGQTESPGTTLARHEHCPNGTDQQRQRLQSIGRPYSDVQLRIVDDSGVVCPPGVPGEIALRSAAQFRGYWNKSAATLETLRDGWVHSGDIGRMDEEGFVFLVDRKKDMIISGGENIYSREVEEAVLQLSAVSECAVIGIPDAKWGESVCAVIVLRAGYLLTAAQVIEHCRTVIASYKKPKKVIFTSVIPKLPSGKVSKVELRKAYA